MEFSVKVQSEATYHNKNSLLPTQADKRELLIEEWVYKGFLPVIML